MYFITDMIGKNTNPFLVQTEYQNTGSRIIVRKKINFSNKNHWPSEW